MSMYAYRTSPYETYDNPSILLSDLEKRQEGIILSDARLAYCEEVLFWKKEFDFFGSKKLTWIPYKWLSWSYITGKHQYCWLEVAPGYLKQLRKFCGEYNVTPESYPCWKMPGIMPVEYVPASQLKMLAQAKSNEIEQARIYKSLDVLVEQRHTLVKKSLKGTFLLRHHSGHWNPVSDNLIVLKQQVSHLI